MSNQSIKISPDCLKALKENKNKKGLSKFLKLKIEKKFEDQFQGSKQNLGMVSDWLVKKIDSATIFGDMRSIYAKKITENGDQKTVCYFYFKSTKVDLTKKDDDNIAEFLSKCNNQDYFDSLTTLDDL